MRGERVASTISSPSRRICSFRAYRKNGVKLLSITQEIGDDPIHQMMRQIMALFDEYQSNENAKHVQRVQQKENARQGFWNGSLPPIGYRIDASETRRAKVKKKLEIDPLHADTVRLIYRLALDGDGGSGPMGVKNIVSHLNRNRIFPRDGGRWGVRDSRTPSIGPRRPVPGARRPVSRRRDGEGAQRGSEFVGTQLRPRRLPLLGSEFEVPLLGPVRQES